MMPPMSGFQSALRFLLELAALAALAIAAHRLARPLPDAVQWALAIGAVVAAGTAWAVFRVPGDTSANGEAIVAVRGAVRLILELALLLGAPAAVAAAGLTRFGATLAALVVFHYAATWSRVAWLLSR